MALWSLLPTSKSVPAPPIWAWSSGLLLPMEGNACVPGRRLPFEKRPLFPLALLCLCHLQENMPRPACCSQGHERNMEQTHGMKQSCPGSFSKPRLFAKPAGLAGGSFQGTGARHEQIHLPKLTELAKGTAGVQFQAPAPSGKQHFPNSDGQPCHLKTWFGGRLGSGSGAEPETLDF